jgi:hypothetical protein
MERLPGRGRGGGVLMVFQVFTSVVYTLIGCKLVMAPLRLWNMYFVLWPEPHSLLTLPLLPGQWNS